MSGNNPETNLALEKINILEMHQLLDGIHCNLFNRCSRIFFRSSEN